MKSVWKWILFGGAVFLLAFCVALPLFGGFAAMPARTIHSFSVMRGGMMGSGIGWIGGGSACSSASRFPCLLSAALRPWSTDW
jgi:hypothetical protein